MNVNDMLGKLVSGELIVVVQQEPTKPVPMKPKLAAEEQELADSLVAIAKKYGKFNEDETGIWAGYEAAKDNVVAHIGVKCSNCALYEGNGVCKIIAQKVEDGGKCRFAVIPDGVVGGVYDPAKTPVVPVSSGKRKIKIKAEADKSASCPKATRDIATNLKNRAKAIKTAMYGPLNPAEPNDAYYKKLGSEWDVSPEQARKQTCGNCAMFIVTPEMKSCIESGVTGPKGKDEWEAIDAAGHLGYCEAFDFKCASKRTCRAWVTGGPITETKSVKIRPSVKALGATIGGNAAVTDSADMIDRDGDGMIFDGTPDEQPVKRKPKQGRNDPPTDSDGPNISTYFDPKDSGARIIDGAQNPNWSGPNQDMQVWDPQKNPNSFLEERRKRSVNRSLRERGITPTQGNQIQEMEDGSLQLYGRSDEERAARQEARDSFTVDQDRKRFVRNQMAKRGIERNVNSQRSDEERQARREARAEYDRRMNAGAPKKPSIGTPRQPDKPDTSWQDNEDRRFERLRPDTSFQDNEDRRNRSKDPGPRFTTADDARRANEQRFSSPNRSTQSSEQPKTSSRPAPARKPDPSFEPGAFPSGSRTNRDAGFEPGAIPSGSRQVRDAGRNPRNLKERLVTNVFKDDDDTQENRFRFKPGKNPPRDRMPIYKTPPSKDRMPTYKPPKQTGGGRFNGPRDDYDDDRRPRPATVNPREIAGRDAQKNPPSRMQPITRTPNQSPNSDALRRKPRTGRNF